MWQRTERNQIDEDKNYDKNNKNVMSLGRRRSIHREAMSRQTPSHSNTINVFINHFSNGSLSGIDYVILNSRTQSQELENKIEAMAGNKPFSKTNYVQFDYEVPHTGIKIKRDLPLFDTLEIDLFSAITCFRNTVSLVKWDNDTTLQIFKSLSSDYITEIISTNTDIEEIFTRLLQVKYPIENIKSYQNYLRNLKLKDFLTVKDYKFAIDQIIKRISIYKCYTKKEILRITDGLLLTGRKNSL